jgi:hypothetical protein
MSFKRFERTVYDKNEMVHVRRFDGRMFVGGGALDR